MKDKKKSKVYLILIIVFAVIAVCAAGFLIYNLTDNTHSISDIVKNPTQNQSQTQNVTQGAESQKADDNKTESKKADNKSESLEVVENPVDFKTAHEINSDIYSWIYIPNTNVDYPVAQSSDDDDSFYLSHNVYKEYQFSGTIYSEKKNSKDYSDPVTMLYGHNMLNGSMFATLHNFADKDFFDKNEYMYVYTTDRAYTYKIYSAFEYDNRHILNSFDFSDEETFKEFIEMTQNPRSMYSNTRDGVEVTTDDKLLILSTCGNDYRDVRFLVVGVLVNEQIAG